MSEPISREEATKRLKEARFTVQPYLYMNEAFDVAIEALSQPEIPKGRWMRDRHHGAYCSNCKRYAKSIAPEKFCGHCGSDND